jgi:hypothetical protein
LPERHSGVVRLEIDVWGGLDFPGDNPDHHVQFFVNEHLLESRRFDGLVAERIELILEDNIIQESNTLRVALPRDTGYAIDVVMFDGFKVSYLRTSRVTDGELAHGVINPVAAVPSTRVFKDGYEDAAAPNLRFQIAGFAPGAVLWSQIEDELARDVLTGGPVLLPDAAAAWHVSNIDRIKTPALGAPASGYSLPNSLDYLVITHPQFEGALAPLLMLQQSRGFSTAIVRTDDAYAAHSDHVRDPSSIKAVIAAAQTRGARFVLLVGGDSYDYKDYLALGSQSFLPTWYGQTSPYVFHAATDDPYTDINGDSLPDVAIGRLPVRTLVEAQRAVASIVSRGNAVPIRFLGVAGLSQAGEDFDRHSRVLLSYLRQPGQQTSFALADEIGTVPTRNLVVAGLSGGSDWISYLGHSSPNRWAFDNLLDTSQLASISRPGIPAIVSQWGCWNNAFALPIQDTMAHALMLRSNPLAAAVIGSTNLAEDASLIALGTRFFDLIEDGRLDGYPGVAISTIGEALQYAKRDLIENQREHSAAAKTMILFGDPASPISE